MSEDLSLSEEVRYSRHLTLPEVGKDGQKKLRRSSILVVGAGGLGSPVLLYLAAAGIGKIGIIDDDKVDITNLQRQVIHSTAKIGELKVDSASSRINELNPDVEVIKQSLRLNVNNALQILTGWDVVIDGTDNFQTRYTISDACEILSIPWVFGSIHRFEGQVSVFNYQNGPNYRDLFPKAPPSNLAPNCAEAGVLGVLPGIVGSIQATEALKIILGFGEPISGKLLTIDAKNMKMRSLTFVKDERRSPVTEMSEELIMKSCNSIRNHNPVIVEITPEEFMKKKKSGWNPFLLDVRRADEEKITNIGGTDHRIMHIEIPDKLEEIPNDRDIVVYCRTGVRSAAVSKFLLDSGLFSGKIFNLFGGIHLWSDQIDSSLPKY
tara:strand:+ start:40771 stop:41907 length:1137 start_codon:yes stop_codon:yes gene_type:complete